MSNKLLTHHSSLITFLSVSANRQRLVNAAVRARDDVDADEFADSPRCRRARVRRGLHGGNVAAHDCRDEARADLLVAHERDVGGLDHRVRSLDHRHQALRLNHAECFLSHSFSPIRCPYFLTARTRPLVSAPVVASLLTPEGFNARADTPHT